MTVDYIYQSFQLCIIMVGQDRNGYQVENKKNFFLKKLRGFIGGGVETRNCGLCVVYIVSSRATLLVEA